MKRAMILVAAATIWMGCGGGSSGGDGTGGNGNATGTVGTAGGSVNHSSGFQVQIPQGALSGSATVSVKAVALPQALPTGITVEGQAYQVDMGTATMSKPATVSFPLPASYSQASPGGLHIYRWDGQLWTSAGGTVKGSTIATGTLGWSIWVLGTGRSLHKPFDFWNECCYDASVYVHRYFLKHPDLDAPINPLWGFPAFLNAVPKPRALFPQGCYSFCVEWVIPPTTSSSSPMLVHWIVGNVPPPGNWGYCLDQSSNDLVPETVQFTTSVSPYVPGPCPPSQNVGSGGGVPVPLAGTWTLSLRCVTQVNPAMSITFTVSQQGGSFTGSGTGTDYTGAPLSGTIQGGYYASTNTISGTVSISTGTTLARVDSFSAALVSDTGYVPFTVTSHTGYEGCVVEGRFVKQ